jgi:hypothetical protein
MWQWEPKIFSHAETGINLLLKGGGLEQNVSSRDFQTSVSKKRFEE